MSDTPDTKNNLSSSEAEPIKISDNHAVIDAWQELQKQHPVDFDNLKISAVTIIERFLVEYRDLPSDSLALINAEKLLASVKSASTVAEVNSLLRSEDILQPGQDVNFDALVGQCMRIFSLARK